MNPRRTASLSRERPRTQHAEQPIEWITVQIAPALRWFETEFPQAIERQRSSRASWMIQFET
jgi:hypothetical protein